MKTLSIREVQRELGSIKLSDLPVLIKKYKDYFCVMLSFEEYEKLLEASEYQPLVLYEENQQLRRWFEENRGKEVRIPRVEDVFAWYEGDGAGGPPKTESKALTDFKKQMEEKFGVKTTLT
jgi:hypothetical protein